MPGHDLRHDWRREEVAALYALPFSELLYRAHGAHRAHHDPRAMQLSTLLSVKTGGCPEDCAYCPQSAHHETELRPHPLLPLEQVLAAARAAQEAGATRFCMGAAWRAPKGRDFERVLDMVRAVKAMGLETCVTAGMLEDGQAQALKAAGLDYYNHNLDTSPEYYGQIITTREYADRLQTLAAVRAAGLNTCCGGIVGMGESEDDRLELLRTLANLPAHPESVPLNLLVPVPGTPLADAAPLDELDFVRLIAVARLLMPRAVLRLSAGREGMGDALQALCFFAGANSIFYGERLLTTANPGARRDRALLDRLGMHAAA
jgi:biotin synthase